MHVLTTILFVACSGPILKHFVLIKTPMIMVAVVIYCSMLIAENIDQSKDQEKRGIGRKEGQEQRIKVEDEDSKREWG